MIGKCLFRQLFEHVLFQPLLLFLTVLGTFVPTRVSALSVSTVALVFNSHQFSAIHSFLGTIQQSSQFFTPILSPAYFFLLKSRTVLQLLLEQLFLVCTVRTRGCLSRSHLACGWVLLGNWRGTFFEVFFEASVFIQQKK